MLFETVSGIQELARLSRLMPVYACILHQGDSISVSQNILSLSLYLLCLYHLCPSLSLSLSLTCIYVSLQEFISRQVSAQPDHSFWIGLSRRRTEEPWLWEEGSTLLSNL